MNPRYFDPDFGAIISRGLGKGIGLGFGLGLGKSLFKGFEALLAYYEPELEDEIVEEEEGFCQNCLHHVKHAHQGHYMNTRNNKFLVQSTPSQQRLMKAILQYFSINPQPTKIELHRLAKRLGLNPPQLHRLAHMTISEVIRQPV